RPVVLPIYPCALWRRTPGCCDTCSCPGRLGRRPPPPRSKHGRWKPRTPSMRTGLNSPASSSARDPNLRVDSVAGSSRSDVAEELGPDVCVAVLDRAHMRDVCGSQLTRFIAARFQLGVDIPAFELPRGRCRHGLVVGER